MMENKKQSSGIIVKIQDRFLVGHVTNNERFDVFKGGVELGETSIEAAIRECYEESGLVFKPEDLTFVDTSSLNHKKDLTLYIVKLDSIEMHKLKCITSFDDMDGNPHLEIDFYATMEFDELLPKFSNGMRSFFERNKDFIIQF